MSLLDEYMEAKRQVERVQREIAPLHKELDRHKKIQDAAIDRLCAAIAKSGPTTMWAGGKLWALIPVSDQYKQVRSFKIELVLERKETPA